MKTFYFVALVLLVCLVVVAGDSLSPPRSGATPAPAPDLSAYPWFYRRDGRPLAAAEPVVELIAVGDVMLGRGVAGEAAPLAEVASWLQAADLVLGNLESVIVEAGTPREAPAGAPQPYILNAPVTAAATLANAGFDLLGLANNHSLDYGAEGLEETAARLQAAGLATLGAGPDAAAANEALLYEIKGVRLAFLAFNAIPDPGSYQQSATSSQLSAAGDRPAWVRADWDEATAPAAIAAARALADVVIVSVHWGYEYQLRPDPAQERMAQAMLAAGADVVLGHHPHVAQPVQVAGQRLVAYSLGNFVFDQGQEETKQGLALRLFLDRDGLRAAQALPLWNGPRPRLMAPAEAASLLARIQPPPRRLGFACDGEGCQPVEAPQTAATGGFWSGEIDLTGDGEAEQVRRLGEQVTVYRQGAVAWQSPPEWRVVDVALGDPNDDGRGEIMLAIWRPDPDGHERSQPYMVGYRGGEYKVMWGGRPVVDPIQEIELGDVTGDGRQELVVIEERADGSRTVAVWRWQGWSFSLLWRSEPGRYRELVLLPGRPAVISVMAE